MVTVYDCIVTALLCSRLYLVYMFFVHCSSDRPNSSAWVFAEDLDDEDIVDSVHRLPLYVYSFKLMLSDEISVSSSTHLDRVLPTTHLDYCEWVLYSLR